MSATVTVTAPTGAGSSVSAKAFTNVRNINIDPIGTVLQLTLEDGSVREFDLAATATITATAASGVFTFTFAQ